MTEAALAARAEQGPNPQHPVQHEGGILTHINESIRGTRIGNALSVIGVAAAFSATEAATGTPDASAANYSVGPALSTQENRANRQLDEVLRETGPNGDLAVLLGKSVGINTAKGRAKYITPENTDIRDLHAVSNDQYPVNSRSGAVFVPNKHKKSDAYKIAFDNLPERARSATRQVAKKPSEIRAESHSRSNSESVSKTEAVVKKSVLRRLCENLLKQKGNRRGSGRVSPKFKMNVKYGVMKRVTSMAKSEDTSNSFAGIRCPDGTFLNAGSNAKATAWAKAVASVKAKGSIYIKGRGFGQMRAGISAKVKAFTKAATSTETKSVVQGECGELPPPNPETCQPGDVEIVNPVQHVFPNGQVKIRVRASDPDTPFSRLRINLTASRGTVSDLSPEVEDDGTVVPNTLKAFYTADSSSGGTDTLEATVSDGVDANCEADNYEADDRDRNMFNRPGDLGF